MYILQILLSVLTSIYGTGDDGVFLKTYGGNPYMGTVQVDIIRPDGSYVKTEFGDGSGHFVSAAKGKVKMIIFGAIKNKDGDAGFSIDGTSRQKSWKSESDSVKLSVSESGAISGGGKNYPQQFTFSGKITVNRIELVTEIKALKASEGGLPAGTRFVFRYVLRRDIVRTKGTGKKPCNKIIWQPQYVGNFDGTGTTVRVPRCADK